MSIVFTCVFIIICGYHEDLYITFIKEIPRYILPFFKCQFKVPHCFLTSLFNPAPVCDFTHIHSSFHPAPVCDFTLILPSPVHFTPLQYVILLTSPVHFTLSSPVQCEYATSLPRNKSHQVSIKYILTPLPPVCLPFSFYLTPPLQQIIYSIVFRL